MFVLFLTRWSETQYLYDWVSRCEPLPHGSRRVCTITASDRRPKGGTTLASRVSSGKWQRKPFRILMAGMLLWVGGTVSAEVEFHPVLELRAFSDGNPNIVGAQTESDNVARVGLDLAWRSIAPRTRWDLTYTPYREAFSGSTIRDNTGHLLNANLEHEISPRSAFGLELDASRTERQEVRYQTLEIPESVIPRTTIDMATVNTRGKFDVAPRSFVTWRAGGGVNHYRDTVIDFQNSEWFDLGFGWGHYVTRRATLGVSYSFRNISFETADTTQAHTLDLSSSVNLSPKLTMSARAGVIQVEVGGGSTTTTSLDVNLVRVVDRGTNLVFGVRQLVSPGSGVTSGATEDIGGYGSWRYDGSRHYSADVTVRYWHRQRVDAETTRGPGNKAVQTSESLLWTVSRRVSLGVFHTYTDQQAIGGADPEFNDAKYHTGGVIFRWAVLGR
jgi:hypothetical protein